MSKIDKPLDSWREELTEEQFHICRLGGTERAFSGEYHATKTPGIYHCTCCGTALFDSDAKYDSGSGWPSYFQPVDAEAVRELDDFSHGMHRIEVRCGRCDAHLGHVFPDGPRPTGLRYCINSASLEAGAAGELESDDPSLVRVVFPSINLCAIELRATLFLRPTLNKEDKP